MAQPLLYPAALPAVAKWEGEAMERRAGSTLPGKTLVRGRWHDRLMDVQAEWVYSVAQMAVWRRWFDQDLVQGLRWFGMKTPGQGGPQVRVVRFRRETLRIEPLGSGWHRVTALMKVRGLSMVPELADITSRFWRLAIAGVGTGATVASLSAFGMGDGEGVELLDTATVGASSFYAVGYEPANLVDDSITTVWASAGAPPQYVTASWAAPVAVKMVRLRAPLILDVQAPTNFTVQYAQGSDWKTLFSGSMDWLHSGITGQVAAFWYGVQPAKSSWRIWSDDGTRPETVNGFALAEVQMRASVGGANLIDPPQFLTGNYNGASSTTYVTNLLDGDNATSWTTGTSAAGFPPGWVRYDFPGPVDIAEVLLRAPTDQPSKAPRSFRLQYLDEAGLWADAIVRSAEPAWSAGEARLYTA